MWQTVSCTLLFRLNVAYLFGWKERKQQYIFLKMAAKDEILKNVDLLNGKTLAIVSYLTQPPPSFSLVPTFKLMKHHNK